MLSTKILLLVALLIVPCASADMFDDVTGGLFADIEDFLQALIIVVVGIFALYSIIAVIVGWFTHNNKLFIQGVKGCGAIILAAVVYFIALNGFNYIVDNYW